MKVSRSVAANMLQVKVKEGEDYAKLPDFVKVTGTVGEYKPSINKLALGSMAIGGALGRGGNAGVNAVKGVGGVVGDVGGALGGLFKKKELTKEGETKEPTEGEKIVEETTKGLLKGIFGGGKKKE